MRCQLAVGGEGRPAVAFSCGLAAAKRARAVKSPSALARLTETSWSPRKKLGRLLASFGDKYKEGVISRGWFRWFSPGDQGRRECVLLDRQAPAVVHSGLA